MKIYQINSKLVFFTALIFMCFQIEIFSQIRHTGGTVKPGLFIGLDGGLAQTHIITEGILSVAGLKSNSMNSFTGSAEFGYFFSGNLGLSTGIEYNSYRSQVNLTSYQNNFNTQDSENEPYERRVTGSNIREDQEIGIVSVPFYLNFRLPFGKVYGFFLKAGANVAVPIKRSYSGSGTFTYKGYFPAYNVLLENLPAYGFPDNHSTVAVGELELKKYIISAIASAGFDWLVQENIQFGVAATYNKSLSNISAYVPDDKFQLSMDADQLNSLMGGCSKVSLQSIGLKLSIRYYFKPQ